MHVKKRLADIYWMFCRKHYILNHIRVFEHKCCRRFAYSCSTTAGHFEHFNLHGLFEVYFILLVVGHLIAFLINISLKHVIFRSEAPEILLKYVSRCSSIFWRRKFPVTLGDITYFMWLWTWYRRFCILFCRHDISCYICRSMYCIFILLAIINELLSCLKQILCHYGFTIYFITMKGYWMPCTGLLRGNS